MANEGPTRDSERVTLRCKVKYGTTMRLDNIALSSDLSETGLCIKTNNVMDEGTKLYIKIQTGGETFDAEGVVMWSKQVPRGLDKVVKNGMGVRFTKVDEKLVDLCRGKQNSTHGEKGGKSGGA